jgi:hypothetical protein
MNRRHRPLVIILAAAWAVAACAGVGARNGPPTPDEISAAGSCGRAYSSCVAECRSTRDVFDYQRNRRIDTFRTSYFDRCEEACRAGFAACGEAGADVGGAFEKACRSACPVTIWDERIGDFLTTTEAPNRCGDACRTGAEKLRYSRNPSDSQGQ